MKKPSLIIVLAFAAACGAAETIAADSTSTPRVDRREARQAKRIESGKASGQLTTNEAAKLEAQQGRIQAAEAEAKSDGKVTAKERAALTHQQNKANRKIRRNKHDAQKS